MNRVNIEDMLRCWDLDLSLGCRCRVLFLVLDPLDVDHLVPLGILRLVALLLLLLLLRLLPHFLLPTLFLSLEWLERWISEAWPVKNTLIGKSSSQTKNTWRRVHPWTLIQDHLSSPQQEPWSGYCWQRKGQRKVRSCGRQENLVPPPFGRSGGRGVVVQARAGGSGEVGTPATSSSPAFPLSHQGSDLERSEIRF